MVRAFLGVLLAVSAAVAQPAYDILIKGGHVIDPKNNFDAVADVAVGGGKIARVATNIPARVRSSNDRCGTVSTSHRVSSIFTPICGIDQAQVLRAAT